MLWLSIMCLLTQKNDLYVVDQISYSIPILKFFGQKVIYYCHFPEKLLNDNKPTLKIRLYRYFFDKIEGYCINRADIIIFNSEFTKEKTLNLFTRINKSKTLVLYPAVEITKTQNKQIHELDSIGNKNHKPYFLSLNRFERRKNIHLAIISYIVKKKELVDFDLVVAGGLDNNEDNQSYLQELINLAIENGVHKNVSFLTNIDFSTKDKLLA